MFYSVSTTFRYDLMLWSSQLEEACDSLLQSEETESDQVLVAAARLARIAVGATEVARRASEDPSTSRHAIMAIEPLKMSVATLKISLSPVHLQHSKAPAFPLIISLSNRRVIRDNHRVHAEC